MIDIARRGKFFVNREFLTTPGCRAIMSCCIVTRCEYIWSENIFAYEAISPHFFRLEPGTVPPTYYWIIHTDPITGMLTPAVDDYCHNNQKGRKA